MLDIVFEKLLLKLLSIVGLQQIAIPELQFGSCTKHTTLHQSCRVVDYIATGPESKIYFLGLFLYVTPSGRMVLLFKLKKNIFYF